jgi:hypothetical protein
LPPGFALYVVEGEMTSGMKTILALTLAAAPCFAQAADKPKAGSSDQQEKCKAPGKDTVCFDARTTGSLGQMHVRKSKTLVITHLNRIKNDYTLQRGITVQTAQADLLSGLSFVPTAPANPPATPQAQGGATTPPAQKDLIPLTSPPPPPPPQPGAPVRRMAGTPPPPVYSPQDAQKYLDLYSAAAADKILLKLGSAGFSAADLKAMQTAMASAASAIVANMNKTDVAAAMPNPDKVKPYLDEISDAENVAYQTSTPFVQHQQFAALTEKLDSRSGDLTKLQQDLFLLKNKVAQADRDLAAELASVQAFAVASDSLDPGTMMNQLGVHIAELDRVTKSSTWPFDDRAACNVEMLQVKQAFGVLASMPGYNDWKGTDAVKDRLTAFSSTLDADVTYINSLNPDNSDRVTAIGKAKGVLAHFQWVNSLDGKPDLIEMEEVFACNDDTQKADYTLIVNDLTDSKTAATVPVVTFTCYAPLSLSGGIGFNSLAERTYQLVTPAGATPAGGTAPPSTIQYDKNSNFQIAPLLLLNVRLCNLQDWGALHASFGAGVSIPASGSGTTSGTGSQATYLGGLSVSLRDKVYFTLGPFFGRTNTLASGYSIGSSLPSGVTTIPLQTKFSAGFGVAVTYKLK